MIKINLLPVAASKKKEKIMNQLLLGVLVILATLGGLGFRYYTLVQDIAEVNRQIETKKQEIAKLEEVEKTLKDLKTQESTAKQQLEAIQVLESGRDWFIRVLDKITESVPREEVWITNLKYPASGSITIRGSAFTKEAVAIFMGNLSIIPCDEMKPNDKKAPVCIERNDRCTRYNEDTGTDEWNFEGCRAFYKEKARLASTCDEDVRLCNKSKQNSCSNTQQNPNASNSPACKEYTLKCAEKKNECEQAKKDHGKLHEEEFIVYDSVSLKYIRLKGGGRGQAGTYQFELSAAPTAPRQ